jgi:hypothetical protein
VVIVFVPEVAENVIAADPAPKVTPEPTIKSPYINFDEVLLNVPPKPVRLRLPILPSPVLV